MDEQPKDDSSRTHHYRKSGPLEFKIYNDDIDSRLHDYYIDIRGRVFLSPEAIACILGIQPTSVKQAYYLKGKERINIKQLRMRKWGKKKNYYEVNTGLFEVYPSLTIEKILKMYPALSHYTRDIPSEAEPEQIDNKPEQTEKKKDKYIRPSVEREPYLTVKQLARLFGLTKCSVGNICYLKKISERKEVKGGGPRTSYAYKATPELTAILYASMIRARRRNGHPMPTEHVPTKYGDQKIKEYERPDAAAKKKREEPVKCIVKDVETLREDVEGLVKERFDYLSIGGKNSMVNAVMDDLRLYQRIGLTRMTMLSRANMLLYETEKGLNSAKRPSAKPPRENIDNITIDKTIDYSSKYPQLMDLQTAMQLALEMVFRDKGTEMYSLYCLGENMPAQYSPLIKGLENIVSKSYRKAKEKYSLAAVCLNVARYRRAIAGKDRKTGRAIRDRPIAEKIKRKAGETGIRASNSEDEEKQGDIVIDNDLTDLGTIGEFLEDEEKTSGLPFSEDDL